MWGCDSLWELALELPGSRLSGQRGDAAVYGGQGWLRTPVGSRVTVCLPGASLLTLPPSNPSTLTQIIKKLIERKQAQIRKVYPGLTCFKEGVRQIPIESVPGIRESCRLLAGKGWLAGRAPSSLARGCGADLVMFTLDFQEKRAGNRWGRRRGECCAGKGEGVLRQLGCEGSAQAAPRSRR